MPKNGLKWSKRSKIPKIGPKLPKIVILLVLRDKEVKTKSCRVWPIRSKCTWSHVEEQKISAGGTMGKFSKNLFS